MGLVGDNDFNKINCEFGSAHESELFSCNVFLSDVAKNKVNPLLERTLSTLFVALETAI